MKHVLAIVLFLFGLNITTFSQDQLQVFQVDDNLSISLPGSPLVLENGQVLSLTLSTKGATIIIIRSNQNFIDPEMYIDDHVNILEKYGNKDIKSLESTIGKSSATFHLEFKKSSGEIVDEKIFFLKDKFYHIFFTGSADQQDLELKKRIFESIQFL